MITWSVIDLGKMDRVGECVNRFFDVLCRAYTQYPELMRIYAFQIINSERYGSRSDSMYDLASLFYNAGLYQTRETNIRQEFLEAIEDAVVYNVRGSDHFGARGLSSRFRRAKLPSFPLPDARTWSARKRGLLCSL